MDQRTNRRTNGWTHALIESLVATNKPKGLALVYYGCHVYPGQGVYLLKLDNSYTVWWSKNLFYCIYYTR